MIVIDLPVSVGEAHGQIDGHTEDDTTLWRGTIGTRLEHVGTRKEGHYVESLLVYISRDLLPRARLTPESPKDAVEVHFPSDL